MLRLQQLRLTQFKNHPNVQYAFTERVVGIAGPNGVGKTNLLDAIYALCFSRGYFSRSDQYLVRHGAIGFRLDGITDRRGTTHEIGLVLRESGKKEIWLDKDLLPRLSEYLGRFPVVMIAPDDSELIMGESKSRRQFLDALISQLDPSYLSALTKFNRLLQQRQALLRECAEQGSTTTRLSLLDVLDEQWAETIRIILPARRKWTEVIKEYLIEQYRFIAGNADLVGMEFVTEMGNDDPLESIRKNRPKDLIAQRNTLGPHRDDILFRLGDHPFKQVASQGQRKTLLFSLKLAERSLLEEQLQLPPLLLLDDVFEKLDPGRIQSLLHWVSTKTNSQVFITDTDPDRLRESLQQLEIPFQLLQMEGRS